MLIAALFAIALPAAALRPAPAVSRLVVAHGPSRSASGLVRMQQGPSAAAALAMAATLGTAQAASAARSGGHVGGRVGGGGGGRRGGGGGYRGGGPTNVIIAPPPLFSPFGFSPFGFSPFGFGGFFGFGIPAPLLLLGLGGLALTSFRSARGIEAADAPGAALCLQVACYCSDRSDSLYGRLQSVARTADTQSYEGLQRLVSDTCLAMLRSSKDWMAGRVVSATAGVFTNDVESRYNRLVVQERSKWEEEQGNLKRTSVGEPTYMVATLVILLREGKDLPAINGASDLREAISQIAADVGVEDNLLAAELLWTPEDSNDVMDRDDMFLSFPELVML